MPKTRSQEWYRKKLVEEAKTEAKERDKYTCQYCGVKKEWGHMIHASHILPEWRYRAMATDPYNIIALCAIHHLAGANPRMGSREPSWHGDPLLFSAWFNKKYPGRYKELLKRAQKVEPGIDWKKRWEQKKKLSTAGS